MFTSLNNYCMSDYLQYCTPYPGGHAIQLADCSAECWLVASSFFHKRMPPRCWYIYV